MKTMYETRFLKGYIEQIRGVSYKKNQVSEVPKKGYIPLIRATNIQNGELVYEDLIYVEESIVKEEQKIQLNDIIIAASSGSKHIVGKAAQAKESKLCTFGAFCKLIRPKINEIDPLFLNYFFKTNYYSRTISESVNGANINNIRNEHIDNLVIPIPSINNQRRIGKTLKLAESLINKRKAQIAALSSLAQSVFLEMFGEPSSNKHNFEKIKLSDAIISLEAGLSTGGENKIKKNNELGVLTTSAVTYGIFNPNAYKVLNKKIDKEKKLIHPTKYSILVSRMNTKDLVGASCIVEEDYYDLFIPDRLWKIILNLNIVNPYYFINAIQQKYFRAKLSKEATGTSGSMLNISQQKFKNMEILLPSIDQQNKFSDILNKISKSKLKIQRSLLQLETNFNSLLHRAFKGELFND
ncbi:restriction endonuclease subunit S [Fictibacillus gelatini]|uniref:restriction endonuclease subunit S n=1 Tax=Fictibacillus gelatini TaxID=225985 RepID=UPI00040AB816|nr:restriction endonuclease subunit S [Fictibacillus gelatini]